MDLRIDLGTSEVKVVPLDDAQLTDECTEAAR